MSTPPPDEAALLARAVARDGRAFAVLVRRYETMAFHAAFSVVRHREDAREVVQDAFLRIWRSLPTFRADAAFATWVYRVVQNLAIDVLRKRRAEGERASLDDVAESDLAAHHPAHDPLIVIDRKRQLARAERHLATLSTEHSAVLLLREAMGLSYRQIADRQEVPLGTVMSRLHHARARVARVVAEDVEIE